MNTRSFLSSILVLIALPMAALLADHHAKNPGAFRHVVLFKFKEGTPAETITEIETAFRALPDKIDAIKDFEWGTSKTVEVELAQRKVFTIKLKGITLFHINLDGVAIIDDRLFPGLIAQRKRRKLTIYCLTYVDR